MAEGQSFLVRHEFLIRRLHSLSGLIPVGAYMVMHLMVNASVADDPSTFQGAVYGIHRLGIALPIESGSKLRGAVVLEVADAAPGAARSLLHQLRWGCGWSNRRDQTR